VVRVINPLVESFAVRSGLVMRLGGKSIQRHLRDHMENIGRMAIGSFDDLPFNWTADMDDMLMIHVDESAMPGRRSGAVMGLKGLQVKNCYRVLHGRDMARERPPVITRGCGAKFWRGCRGDG
jgi:hypothetical protein